MCDDGHHHHHFRNEYFTTWWLSLDWWRNRFLSGMYWKRSTMDTSQTSDIGKHSVKNNVFFLSHRHRSIHFRLHISISAQLIQNDRKSILMIPNMDASLTGPYLCQTNQSISTIILQFNSRENFSADNRFNDEFLLFRTNGWDDETDSFYGNEYQSISSLWNGYSIELFCSIL